MSCRQQILTQLAVDVHFTPFILNDTDVEVVSVSERQNVVEQCRFAGSQEPGKDSDWYLSIILVWPLRSWMCHWHLRPVPAVVAERRRLQLKVYPLHVTRWKQADPIRSACRKDSKNRIRGLAGLRPPRVLHCHQQTSPGCCITGLNMSKLPRNKHCDHLRAV